MSSEELRLTVQVAGREPASITVGFGEAVESVKSAVGVEPVEQYEVVLGGAVLEDHTPLADTGVTQECEVEVRRTDWDVKVDKLEERYGITFPPYYREYLKSSARGDTPTWTDDGVLTYQDWVNSPPTFVQERKEWVLDGVAFDIDMNNFWLDSMGPRPESDEERREVASRAMSAVKLFPVSSGHRFGISGPPFYSEILSIYQTDAIVYGENWASYLAAEVGYTEAPPDTFADYKPLATLPFWGDILFRY